MATTMDGDGDQVMDDVVDDDARQNNKRAMSDGRLVILTVADGWRWRWRVPGGDNMTDHICVVVVPMVSVSIKVKHPIEGSVLRALKRE